jgi:hypothetical protein
MPLFDHEKNLQKAAYDKYEVHLHEYCFAVLKDSREKRSMTEKKL